MASPLSSHPLCSVFSPPSLPSSHPAEILGRYCVVDVLYQDMTIGHVAEIIVCKCKTSLFLLLHIVLFLVSFAAEHVAL